MSAKLYGNMIKLKIKKNNLLKYFGEYSSIILYQLVSKSLVVLIMWLLRQAVGGILWVTGRPAFTSGDVPYLLRTWQGWSALLIGFTSLVIYTTFDINAMILMSQNVLYHKKESFLSIFKKSLFFFPQIFLIQRCIDNHLRFLLYAYDLGGSGIFYHKYL